MGTKTSSAVLRQADYLVSFDGLGIPSHRGVEVHVVRREKEGWSKATEEPLAEMGNVFVGYASLKPGDMFLVFVAGLDRAEAERIFDERRRNGLTHPAETFIYSQGESNGFYTCVVDNPRLPIATGHLRFPVNIVPDSVPELAVSGTD